MENKLKIGQKVKVSFTSNFAKKRTPLEEIENATIVDIDNKDDTILLKVEKDIDTFNKSASSEYISDKKDLIWVDETDIIE